MKTKYKILTGIFVLGLIFVFVNLRSNKKLLKMATEPIEIELERVKGENHVLTLRIKKDSLELIKMHNAVHVKIDSLENLIKKNEKTIVNYGGSFDERFRIFTNNLSGNN